MELPHMAQLGREPPATAPSTGADAATDQPHTSEPAMTQTPDLIDDFLDAVDRAYADALARHEAGTCGESEWSCSYCEALADAPDLTDDLAAVREVGWIAREARTMVAERVPQDSPRWWAYMERKRALLAHIEARADG